MRKRGGGLALGAGLSAALLAAGLAPGAPERRLPRVVSPADRGPHVVATRARGDLVVRRLRATSAAVAAGELITVSYRVVNVGRGRVGPFAMGYWLSRDRRSDGRDIALTGRRAIRPLSAGAVAAGRTRLVVPKGTPLRTYHLIACADPDHRVRERRERNNCRAASRRLIVGRAAPPPAGPHSGPPSVPPAPSPGPDVPPPSMPVITGHPADPTNQRDARFEFSAAGAGVGFRCQLDGAQSEECQSPHTYAGPLSDGPHVFAVAARSGAGAESASATFTWSIDTVAPAAPALHERPPAATRERSARFAFSAGEPGVRYACRVDAGTFVACMSPQTVSELAEATHTFTVRAIDPAGNESPPSTVEWTVDRTPPAGPRIDAAPPETTTAANAAFAFTGEEPDLRFRCRLDGAEEVECASPKDYPGPLAEGAHTFAVRAVDAAGNRSAPAERGWEILDAEFESNVGAPPLDRSVATSVAHATRFLYSGSDPVQIGVAPDTIKPERAAVLRGEVRSRDGDPLAGVAVTVLDHPELGATSTRADGRFDLAVNGGGPLTLRLEKAGHLEAHRQVAAPWQNYVHVEPVVLIRRDQRATPIDVGSAEPMQVARASEVSDDDGTRRATLLFAAGTQAEAVMPDGATRQLPELTVRATEYTVGEAGADAMPAELPPTSGYTYATELSVDQADAAGATDVRFSQPVLNYVENFLDFPVGTPVPAGYYDRQRGEWVASDNGLVVKILTETDGRANVDTDGDGLADEGISPAFDGVPISDAERERLAGLYEPGQTLWRVPVEHFTPWDYNWPFGCSGEGGSDCEPPDQPPPQPDEPPDDESCEAGSVISCESQTLGESLTVTGTPFSLTYRSDRVPGRDGSYRLRMPLSGARVPARLTRIDLKVSVAGREFSSSFPAAPNQAHNFVWDGRDAYGRRLQGRQPIGVRIGYTYPAVYLDPERFFRAFAAVSGAQLSRGGTADRLEITVWQAWRGHIGSWNAAGAGLGGWELSRHHAYDPSGRTVYFGDGSQRSARALHAGVIETVAGGGQDCPTCTASGFRGDGGPATEAQLNQPEGVSLGPDGAMYIADSLNSRIRRVSRAGTISTVAGSGPGSGASDGFSGDGGPATEARLHRPHSVAVGRDGSLYIADTYNHRIRRVSRTGTISTVAGSGATMETGDSGGFSGDGGPATEARLAFPDDVAFGTDGSLYIADTTNSRIRRVGPDGTITTVAGGGCDHENCFRGDGRPATQSHLDWPTGVAVGPDGSVYIADFSQRIRRVAPDGILTTIAGTGLQGQWGDPTGDGGPATNANLTNPWRVAVAPDGTVYFSQHGGQVGNDTRVRRVTPDGTLSTIAGGRELGFGGDGGPATAAQFHYLRGLAVGPDGAIYVADWGNARIRRVQPLLPGLSTEDYAMPSEDGSELYFFDAKGRHLRTLDGLTESLRYEFHYTANGQLDQIQDGDGNTTRIERDAAGQPTAIIAPGGQHTDLTVDSDGYLNRVTNPADESTSLAYGSRGLLTSLTTPRHHSYRFGYDSDGRLIRDEDPGEGVKTLHRTETSGGYEVAVRTALGREREYGFEELPTGTQRRTWTSASGAERELVSHTDGSQAIQEPDGTKVTRQLDPDPRFGMLAPVVATETVTTPGGLNLTTTTQRTAELTSASGVTRLQSLRNKVSVNGRTAISTYNAATRKLTQISPTGREFVTTLDGQARPVKVEPASGVEPFEYSYDSTGRLVEERQRDRTITYTYDSKNRLASATDAAAHSVRYGYDRADRVTELKLPSGNTYGFAYDAIGNRTEVRMPSGVVHRFEHTPVDLEKSYTLPVGDSVTRDYDRDRALTKTTLASGRTIENSHDGGGRATRSSYDEASVAFAYADATDRVRTLTRASNAGGATASATLAYDGPLLTSQTLAGPTEATVDYAYDDNLVRTNTTLISGNGTVEMPIAHDADGLVTRVGPFDVARQGPGGAVSEISDGTLSKRFAYDALARLSRRTQRVGGKSLFELEISYDLAGRIARRTEIVGGTRHVYDYAYDEDGQLIRVERDGQVTERYAYDHNGNRTMRQLGQQPAESADYDAQDRLTRRGRTSYEFDADGLLRERGQDSFRYSASGELLVASVSGAAVTYGYDAVGRQIERREDNGRRIAYIYGNPEDPFRMTATKDETGRLTTLDYDQNGHLIALKRAGNRFYVATDHVGSPRLVANEEGQIVKRLDYDTFGVLTADSEPGFDLPLGFAGGLRDDVTGLTRFGFRDYDAAAGRWMARDPIGFDGGDPNLYRYGSNDPVNSRDPSGLATNLKGILLYWTLELLALRVEGDPFEEPKTSLEQRGPKAPEPPKPPGPPGGTRRPSGPATQPQRNLRDVFSKEHAERIWRTARNAAGRMARGCSNRLTSIASLLVDPGLVGPNCSLPSASLSDPRCQRL